MDYAKRMIELTEENLASIKTLSTLNNGREINRSYIEVFINTKIRKGLINPNIHLLLLGEGNEKYVKKMREFIAFVAKKMGDPVADVYKYFALLVLFKNMPAEQISKMGLSASLNRSILHNVGGIKKVHYLSINYIHLFMYTICAFIYEISSKFEKADPSQKPKLVKLYNARDRITMLINAAYNTANRTLEGNSFEGKNILDAIKRFIAANKDLITPNDMFKSF